MGGDSRHCGDRGYKLGRDVSHETPPSVNFFFFLIACLRWVMFYNITLRGHISECCPHGIGCIYSSRHGCDIFLFFSILALCAQIRPAIIWTFNFSLPPPGLHFGIRSRSLSELQATSWNTNVLIKLFYTQQVLQERWPFAQDLFSFPFGMPDIFKVEQ